MKPAPFKLSNHRLGPPEGMESEVPAIDVAIAEYDGMSTTVISCWEPTEDEIEEIIRTKRVWLGILGESMPPAWLSGHDPFAEHTTDDHGNGKSQV